MSFREDLKAGLADLNTQDILIDKDARYKGRAATMVAFLMRPEGHVLPLSFEIWIADDMKCTDEEKVNLVHSYAANQAAALLLDDEAVL